MQLTARQRYRRTEKARAAKRRQKSARKRVDVIGRLLKSARQRCNTAGIPYALTREDVRVPERCPVLGVPLRLVTDGSGQFFENSPSLDRIDPAKGYVPGNVIVVSRRANTLKSNATPAELRAVADFYEVVFG